MVAQRYHFSRSTANNSIIITFFFDVILTLILLILYFSKAFKFSLVLKLFSGNRTIVLLLLPVFLFFYHFLNYTNEFYANNVLNFGFWNDFFHSSYNGLNFLSALLILMNGIVLNKLFNRSNFFDRITYLIAPFYLVLMTFFEVGFTFCGMLVAHTFLIFMLQQLFELNQNDDSKSTIFNVMFLAGVAATFLPSLIFVMPLFLIMIRCIRPLRFRDILVGLIAGVLPFVYLYAAFYILGYSDLPTVFRYTVNALNGDWLVVLGVLTVAAILGFVTFMSQWQKSAIRTKRQFQMLLVFFFSFLIFAFIHLLSFQQIDFFSLLLLPISILLPFAFRSESMGMATNGAFYMLIVFSVMKFFIFA